MTFEECMLETFQKQIASVSDSLVRTYPLQKMWWKHGMEQRFSATNQMSEVWIYSISKTL